MNKTVILKCVNIGSKVPQSSIVVNHKNGTFIMNGYAESVSEIKGIFGKSISKVDDVRFDISPMKKGSETFATKDIINYFKAIVSMYSRRFMGFIGNTTYRFDNIDGLNLYYIKKKIFSKEEMSSLIESGKCKHLHGKSYQILIEKFLKLQ